MRWCALCQATSSIAQQATSDANREYRTAPRPACQPELAFRVRRQKFLPPPLLAEARHLPSPPRNSYALALPTPPIRLSRRAAARDRGSAVDKVRAAAPGAPLGRVVRNGVLCGAAAGNRAAAASAELPTSVRLPATRRASLLPIQVAYGGDRPRKRFRRLRGAERQTQSFLEER